MEQAERRHAVARFFESRRRRGMTLIETALVLAVFAVVTAAIVTSMAENAELTRARAVSMKMIEVKEAAHNYIKANYATLVSKAPKAPGATVVRAGRSSGGSSAPAGSLQAEGFLPDSFIDVNGYGQRHALLIQSTSANQINALVVSYGGRQIPDATLARISSMIGAAGGYVPTKPLAGDAGQVVGAYGGWRTSFTRWGPASTRPSQGRVAATLAFEDGSLLTDYLYRNDIGIPEANRMNTDIDMNSNEIYRVSRISGNSNIRMDTDVTIGRDLWALRDVRVTRDVRAVRNVNAGQNVYADLNMYAGRNVTAGNSLYVGNDGSIGDDLTVKDRTTTESLRVNANANIDGTTTTNRIDANRMVIDSLLESGSSGRSFNTGGLRLSDLLPRQVAQYSYLVTPSNNIVPKPNCAGDTSRARIMLYNRTISRRSVPQLRFTTSGGYVTGIYPDSYVDVAGAIYASHNGSSWRVNWRGQSAAGVTPEAIAQTYCYYG
ncbi:shufflon system plasmid conjugative transfer pilus tip adhesin PilV [Roseibium sp. RKSG952]|uniref:shufflon system plasmid conjugative transfer pilus tip adhesin PilV n=1 Tax=Roseibium sp. RKSG952 TaxID=2529384 RepID=UPI0012BD5DF9|nr:shufflon system plasmid conjugative transfer pilus tip adhesin PilV [Roseibium sp. RKSG952]MTH97588.1 shufflon system plasmid conjugative transfer pilus tip adhesin PilV [Roseibium sp. RKSG952]